MDKFDILAGKLADASDPVTRATLLAGRKAEWKFKDAKSALEVLAELRAQPQNNHLRVIKRLTIINEEILGGPEINNGTVVRASKRLDQTIDEINRSLYHDANTIRGHRPNPPPTTTCSDTGI